MLSNFVFVLFCFWSCNCQISNLNVNSNTGKWIRPQSNSNNQPILNSNIQERFTYPQSSETTKVPVAQITDVNASDGNFPSVPVKVNKPTNINSGAWNPGNPTRAPQQPRSPTNNFNRPLATFLPVSSGNNNNQQVVLSSPTRAPVQSWNPVNNNNQQVVLNSLTRAPVQSLNPVNNNNHQVVLSSPTRAPVQSWNPVNNVPQQNNQFITTTTPASILNKPTFAPLQSSNTGFNNQPKKPIASNPAVEVTTSDPTIFFPENDLNTDRKPVSHNRKPVHSSECDTDNELLYPGDHEGDWACDCKPSYIHHPLTNRCWESHRRGPCGENQILVLNRYNKVPECVKNTCNRENFVFFKDGCYKLGSLDPCPQEQGPRPIMLIVDATTLNLTCSDLHSVSCDINGCCLGGKRPTGQNCIKI